MLSNFEIAVIALLAVNIIFTIYFNSRQEEEEEEEGYATTPTRGKKK